MTPTAANSTDPAAVRQAIEAADTRYTDAAKRGDVAGLTAVYAADAVVLQPGTPAWRGHDAIQKGFGRLVAFATVKDMALHTEDVLVGGDLAVETGSYTMTLQPKTAGAKATTDTGKYVVVWQKQPDGAWKIVRDIGNSDLPAGKT